MKNKYGFLMPLLLLPAYLLIPSGQAITASAHRTSFADSSGIIHVLDGSTQEWPGERFENDKETDISFAADNDATDLYIAMRIPDFPEQIKIMRMGMRFFIDLKAKKKENMGIEFPIKSELGRGSGYRPAPAENGSGEHEKFDPKAMRESLLINLIFLKTFGFDNQDEPHNQGLTMNGSANIAYSWDDSDMMHIEYRIPLQMMGDKKSLQDKEISIGWKINGRENTAAAPTGVTPPGGFGSGRRTSGGGRSIGGRTGGGSGKSGETSQESFEKLMKEQSLWGKYLLSIPSASKGF